jgi:two-component system CheB/CheR fusion protein
MDIRTVFQAQPFLGLLLMVILVYVWRTRKTYPGFGYAILQHIGITLGMQFVSLRGTIPLFVSALLGNGLFLAGMLLALQGIKTFLGRGRMHQGYWIAFVLLEIGVAWFLYVSPDLNARLLLFFLFLGVISLVIARELVFCAPPYLRTSPRFMAVIAGGYGGFIILRGLATLWMPLPALFAPSSLQLATVVVSAAAGFLSTFGFIIMNSERLEHEIRVAGRKLEEERGYLRTVLDSVQSGVIVVDAETHRIVDINAAAGDILGVGREAMAGAVCHGRVCPAEIGKCPVTDLARTVDKGEGEVIHRSSRRIPVIKSVVSVTINGRRCLLESFVDMTERKAAGEALQRAHDELEQKVRERTFQLEQSRQRYRDLAELLPETIFEADAEGRLTYVNFQASETFLYNREELEGIPYDALIAPRDRGRLTEDARKPRDEVAAWGGEYLGRRKDGSEVPLFIRVAAMKRQGVVFGLRGVLIDLTELKRAEEALRKSEEKYRRLFENSRDAIFIATHEGRIVEGNAAFFELFGYDREEMNMLETDEIFVEERQSRAFLLELRERGSVKDFELKIRKKDGSTGDCLVTASREYSTGGMEVGLEGIIRDVTERRRLEREVLEITSAERLEIGQELHDNLGQDLTGIALKLKSMSQSLAKKSLPEANEGERLTELVNRTIGRVRDVAKGLVLIDLEGGDIRPAIRELTERVHSISGVFCLARFTPEEIDVGVTTAMQIYRIAQEAVLNAVRHSGANRVEIHLTQADGTITLTVQDDGIGISPSRRSGNGLGLRLMKYRAQLINGSLDIRSGPGGGTTVECVLAER